ncbi:PD-(D/E)XK motif protein [Thermodesulfobacteriota bacterium B35]
MINPWNEIETPKHDLLYRLVDPQHPLRLLRAKDALGRLLFLYEFSELAGVPRNLPKLKGIVIRIVLPQPDVNKNGMLVLILKDKKDWQIFFSLCNDIVASTREAVQQNQAVQIILRRLQHWQDFLKRVRPDILPEREIKGLLGELLFITRHLSSAFGLEAAISFWQGPEDAPQDFTVNNCAVEVKCQLGTTTPMVRISSEDQLCPQLPEMFLYVVTLGKADEEEKNGITLPSIIASIRDGLEDCPDAFERFNDLIYQTGYLDREEYEEFRYVPISEKMFSVTTGFPRICPENLSSGITKLTYNIKLLDCEPFEETPGWMSLS